MRKTRISETGLQGHASDAWRGLRVVECKKVVRENGPKPSRLEREWRCQTTTS